MWLPPAITILAVILFGFFGGLLGLLIAAPLTLTIMVIVKMVYVEDDRSITVAGEPEA